MNVLTNRVLVGGVFKSYKDEAMTDYDSMSRKELMALRANIDKAIAAVGDRERRDALKAAEAAVREHGFTLDELVGLMGGAKARGRRASGTGAKGATNGSGAAPRFRNPDDHSQTWSGRGRRPRWIHEAEAAGRSLQDMEIR
jgi:DNA-binding protein H-NS